MGQFGKYLLIFGIGSFILNLIGMEFTILMWIDMWGTTTGMFIRIGMIAAGAALIFLSNKAEQDLMAEAERSYVEE